MRHYKQKTIALIIASTLTVVGAFGASNYKNSLMSLKFEGDSAGAVKMTVMTKIDYTNSIIPVKRDANTYIIMLPETNSELSSKPTLSGNVESVDIRTMPYTTSAKGYTKITVKTTANTPLSAQKALYIPEINKEPEQHTEIPNVKEKSVEEISEKANTDDVNNNVQVASQTKQESAITNSESTKDTEFDNKNNNLESQNNNTNIIQSQKSMQSTSSDNSMELIYLSFAMLLIITVSIYLFVKGANKINEIIGEQNNIDLDDETKKIKETESKKTEKKIKKTIKKLDEMYKKPVSMPIGNHSNIEEQTKNDEITENPVDSSDIIDLDELFQEQNKQEENTENNDNLDDFLSEFFTETNEQESPHDAIIQDNSEEDKNIDELFNRIKNIDKIQFSASDIENINKLLNIEISDDYQKEVKELLEMSSKTPERTLEKMVTDLLAIHNISFTQEDIDAIEKLMYVEIDRDFVTNLQTNPILTQRMESDILRGDIKKHNTREILTLRVRESLPDLSKEIIKKRIESCAKPEVIYFEKGYDVNILKTEDLPDLSVEINNYNKDYVPSVDIVHEEDKIISNPEEISTIKVADELPDLEDVKANPQKYEEKKKIVHADERTLFKNLNSVVFKPFYTPNDNKEAQEEIYNDKSKNTETAGELSEFIGSNVDEEEINVTPAHSQNNAQVEDLLDIIEKQKEERKDKAKTSEIIQKKFKNTPNVENVEKSTPKITECTVDGVNYSIIAYSNFTNDIGCCLATSESDEYAILGFIGDKIFKVKHYEKVKNTTMQSRISEKFDDGKLRYIVRIGIHKFVLDVSDDNMEYVMDLC